MAYINITPLADQNRYTELHELDELRRYRICNELGRGAFGSVYRCVKHSSNAEVAIKMIKRWPQGGGASFAATQLPLHLVREVENFRLLSNHHHIVNFREVFLTPNYLGIVMEFVNAGTLREFLARNRSGLPEVKARWLFQQLIIAVHFCHRMGVAVRDLKPENALLHVANRTWTPDGDKCPTPHDWPVVKLCDFGLSKNEYSQSWAKTAVGTEAYIAPEIYAKPSGQAYRGSTADMWSIGIMLYEMIYGRAPFTPLPPHVAPAERLKKFTIKVLQDEPDYPECPGVSRECIDLIKRLLVKQPEHRITIDEVYKHPWFLEGLPEGAVELNEKVLNQPIQLEQSASNVQELLQEAFQAAQVQLHPAMSR